MSSRNNGAAHFGESLKSMNMETFRTYAPGVTIATVIAMGAAFVSTTYGGSLIVFSLFLGMALHFLAEEESCVPGIQFAAENVLRVGVALLGARITVSQISDIGWVPLAIVAASVAVVIAFGLVGARVLGMRARLGVLSGGAVAICGASAAAALAAVLPRDSESNRDMAFTVIGVTVLSTIAMVIYPMLGLVASMTDTGSGFFLGATIHGVAQAVGAGYSVSHQSGDVATVVKLFRVALLVPAVLLISVFSGARREGTGKAPVKAPPFLIVFVVLVIVNSFGVIPKPAVDVIGHVSHACLAVAIAAIGVMTSLKDIRKLGAKPVVLILAETFLIGVIGLATAMFALPGGAG